MRAIVYESFVQVADNCRQAFCLACLPVFQESFAGGVGVVNRLLGLLRVLLSLAEVDAYPAAEILFAQGRRFDVVGGQAVNGLDGKAQRCNSRKKR